MAVLKCENCGKMISDKGDDCPYCKTLIHKPNHKQNEVLDPLVLMKKQMFGLIGAALLVVGVFFANRQPADSWQHDLFQ